MSLDVIYPLRCGACGRVMDIHHEDGQLVARWCPFCGKRMLTWRTDDEPKENPK